MEVMDLILALNIKKYINIQETLHIRYENLIDGERGLPEYSKSTIYNVRWSHSKDGKSSPYSSFQHL